jgi:polysaccharide biosynthesis protein PslH
MKVLFFAQQQAWPIDNGARLRNYHLAMQLAKRCSVTFVELRPEQGKPHQVPDWPALSGIVTLPKARTYTPLNVLRGLIGPVPLTVLNCWSANAAAKLARVLHPGRFDSIQIEGMHLAAYLPTIRQAVGNPAIVVDWHNVESELLWRYADLAGNWLTRSVARRTATLVEAAENRLLDECRMHTVTSERERQILLVRRPNAHIRVIPNGVDAAHFSAPGAAKISPSMPTDVSRRSILFVGSLDYHANIDAVRWFARTAWPEISRIHPHLHFEIVGRRPVPEVQALASERIHVSGDVADVRPFYAGAMAVAVPIRCGSGTRLKILEAMAAGVPVISTPLGIEGIDAQEGSHFLSAESAREFVAAIDFLASSPETRRRLAVNARALAADHYDWSIAGEQLYRIHRDLVAARTGRFEAVTFAF